MMRQLMDRRSVVYVMISAAVFACASVFYSRILNLYSIDHYFPHTSLNFWFWVADIVGPLLAAVGIGTLADRSGCKVAISLSIGILSVGLIGSGETLVWIGSVSNPANLGIADTISLVVFHCAIEGAVVAMLITTMVYMFESAPAHLRGLYVAIAVAIQGIAVAICVVADDRFLACARCMKSISSAQLLLIAAVILAPFAVLAWNANEPAFHDGHPAQWRKIAFPGLLLMLLLNFAGIAMLALSRSLGSGYFSEFAYSFLGSLIGAALAILAGFISDRYGRKPAMLIPATLVAVIPVCALLNHVLPFYGVVTVSIVGALAYAFLRPAIFVALIEALPREIRVRSLLAFAAVSDGLLACYQGYKPRGLVFGDLIDWEIVIVVGCCAIALFPNVVQKEGRGAGS